MYHQFKCCSSLISCLMDENSDQTIVTITNDFDNLFSLWKKLQRSCEVNNIAFSFRVSEDAWNIQSNQLVCIVKHALWSVLVLCKVEILPSAILSVACFSWSLSEFCCSPWPLLWWKLVACSSYLSSISHCLCRFACIQNNELKVVQKEPFH